MDFKYLGGYNSPQPPPPHSRSLGGGGGFTREVLRREVKKELIWREIVAEEVARARRRELEEEVRREMVLERKMGMPRHMNLRLNSVDEMPKPRINQNQLQERVNLRSNPQSSQVAMEDMPQPCITDPAEIKANYNQDQPQLLRWNPKSNLGSIEDWPQPRIMDSAEIKANNNQVQLQKRSILPWHSKSNLGSIGIMKQPHIKHIQERLKVWSSPKPNQVAIEDVPQPHLMDPAEIEPANNQDQLQERLTLQSSPKPNQVAIEDMAQPRMVDPVGIKPNNNQDELQERLKLQSSPKLNQVAVEDMLQPRNVDPAGIKPNNNQVQLQERLKLRSSPKPNQVAIEDMAQPRMVDPVGIKPNNNQDELQERLKLQSSPKLNQVAVEDMLQPRNVDPAGIKPNNNQVQLQERLKLRSSPKPNQVPIEDMPQPRMADPAGIKPNNNQDQVQTKPDTDFYDAKRKAEALYDAKRKAEALYDAKRKAEAPAVNDSKFGLMKKPKKEWRCGLCDVSATDELGLIAHFGGKKHKTKEAAILAEKIPKSSSPSLSLTKNVKSTETISTTTSGFDDSQFGLMKKPKDLGCALCGVTTTDESSLNAHLLGKKHRAKEAALGANNIGLHSKADIQAHQALREGSMPQNNVDTSAVEAKKEEQLVQKSQNIGVSEINEVTTEGSGETNAKMMFWCGICGIRTTSQDLMEDHKKGKKHRRQMEIKTRSQNNGSAPPTSSAA